MIPTGQTLIHNYIKYVGFSHKFKPTIFKFNDFRQSMIQLNPVLENIYNLETGQTHYKEFSKNDKHKLFDAIKKLDGWAGLNPASIQL